jgi:hypothetical protein
MLTHVFFVSSDPFTDAAKGDEEGVQDGLVHIRKGKL